MENQAEVVALDPKTKLRNRYRAYLGKEAAPEMTAAELRAALRTTQAYQELFALNKDEAITLEDMGIQTLKNQEIPAWLLNPNHVKKYQNVVKGHGAQFRLPSGKTHFVDCKGPMMPTAPILTEYVFPGVTIFRNVDDGTEEYEWKGSRPVQKKHGQLQPPTDLTQALEKCWRYNPKGGVIRGESFDPEFAVLDITQNEDNIFFFPPGQFNDNYTLRYYATDAAGNQVQVEADANDTARQLGLSLESPARMWKARLRGERIACNGQLSVFARKYDGFFGGGTGFLANVAAQQGTRIKENAKGGKALNLSDLYNAETNPHPSLPVGEKAVYRMESFIGRESEEVWSAYVRWDAEVDRQGNPIPPSMNCVAKSGKNESAFVTYLSMIDGVRKPSKAAQDMLMAE